MTVLRFDDVEKIDDLKKTAVPVPEWGGEVLVRAMMADERSDLEREFTKKSPTSDPGAFRAELLFRTLVNEDGSAWVTRERLQALMSKNAAAVERLFEKSCEINGFRKKDVEELEKN